LTPHATTAHYLALVTLASRHLHAVVAIDAAGAFLLAAREWMLARYPTAASLRGRVPEIGVVARQAIAKCSDAYEDE